MQVTKRKNCRCNTCGKNFHYMGISKHRAMHRSKKEDCDITFTNGDRFVFNFSKSETAK
jgi:hypothetical protein